jgi:hypothetical protein
MVPDYNLCLFSRKCGNNVKETDQRRHIHMTEENKQSNDSIEQQRKKERGEDIEPQRAQDKKEKRPEDKNPDDFE